MRNAMEVTADGFACGHACRRDAAGGVRRALFVCMLLGMLVMAGCGGDGGDVVSTGSSADGYAGDQASGVAGEIVEHYRELNRLVESVETKEDVARVKEAVGAHYESLLRIAIDAQQDPDRASGVADAWRQSEVSELEGQLQERLQAIIRKDLEVGSELVQAITSRMGELAVELAKAQQGG